MNSSVPLTLSFVAIGISALAAIFSLWQARTAAAARRAEFDAAFRIEWIWLEDDALPADELGNRWTGQADARLINTGVSIAYDLRCRTWAGKWKFGPWEVEPGLRPFPIGDFRSRQLLRLKWKDSHGSRRAQWLRIPPKGFSPKIGSIFETLPRRDRIRR